MTRAGQPAQKLDLEGIAPDGEGGFWLASEGRSDRLIPHALLRVDAERRDRGRDRLPAPSSLADETRYGAEGVAVADDTVWIAIQREWGDDPKGQVKLLAYDPEAEEWGAVRYPLDAAPEGGWIGLSEITAHGDHLYLIERDNQIGESRRGQAAHPRRRSPTSPRPRSAASCRSSTKEVVRDLIPDLAAAQRLRRRQGRGLRHRRRRHRLRRHRQRRHRRQLGRDPLPAARPARGDVMPFPVEGLGPVLRDTRVNLPLRRRFCSYRKTTEKLRETYSDCRRLMRQFQSLAAAGFADAGLSRSIGFRTRRDRAVPPSGRAARLPPGPRRGGRRPDRRLIPELAIERFQRVATISRVDTPGGRGACAPPGQPA